MDDEGAARSDTATVSVTNLNPTAGPITGPTDPVPLNTVALFSSPFTDPGILDTHTARWDWGDGSASSSGGLTESGGTGSVTGSHLCSLTGVFRALLYVTDDDAGSGSDSFDYVVVYDPGTGFVTGGGWYSSAATAHKAKTPVAGKASFGFVSKYFKKATYPRGNTCFTLHGAFQFKSTSLTLLTVAGPWAQYQGSGTVDGTQGYSFFLTAVDGQVNDGGGIDKFRIKIWNTKTKAVLYDTQMGAPDSAWPTMPLGGGSITIHS